MWHQLLHKGCDIRNKEEDKQHSCKMVNKFGQEQNWQKTRKILKVCYEMLSHLGATLLTSFIFKNSCSISITIASKTVKIVGNLHNWHTFKKVGWGHDEKSNFEKIGVDKINVGSFNFKKCRPRHAPLLIISRKCRPED